MNISRTRAFAILASNRRARAAEQAEATATHVVRSVNKDGSLSRGNHCGLYQAAGEAETRRAYLESINPGRRFAVVTL